MQLGDALSRKNSTKAVVQYSSFISVFARELSGVKSHEISLFWHNKNHKWMLQKQLRCVHSHIPILYLRNFHTIVVKRAPPLTLITRFRTHGRGAGQKMELDKGGLVIDESSEDESEEGECSSDGEDNPCNLLGIPLDSQKQPKLVEDLDEMETGSEGEADEGENNERDGMEGEEENGDKIRPEKLMQLG